MARKNLNRSLGALAALGALSYHLSQGRGRTDGGAPVEDRSTGFLDNKSSDGNKGGSGYMDLGGYGDMSVPLPEYDAPQGVRVLTPAEREGVKISEGERVSQEAAERAEIARMMNAGHFKRAAAAAGPAAGPARSVAAPAAARSASAELASPDADFPPAGRTRAASSTEQGLTSQRAAPVGDRSAAPPLIRVLPPPLLPLTPLLFNAATARSAAPADAQAQKTAREAAAERRREARRVEPPDVGLNNPYYGRTGAQRTAALRAKGGAIKTKKMASGGMTSASKRGDGIASKGKTKCKMY